MDFNFSTAAGALSLVEVPVGAKAVVTSVQDAGAVGRRLLDLGFVPETGVRLVRHAPLGDPSEYELRGTRLCLRRSEAALVLVRLL